MDAGFVGVDCQLGSLPLPPFFSVSNREESPLALAIPQQRRATKLLWLNGSAGALILPGNGSVSALGSSEGGDSRT